MKLDILTNDGSPLGVSSKSIFGEDGRLGVGGAELALLTMCEEWAKAGHDVTLYNNPRTRSDLFQQRRIDSFERADKRDVLITFRSPNPLSLGANGLHVFWSCDQYTVGSFQEFSKHAHKIVTISPFHADYFEKRYEIKDAVVIDLPVRVDDYLEPFDKVPGRMIFTSVPDRGLGNMAAAWPRIRKEVQNASLVITSDYRLWGCPEPRNDHYRQAFLKFPEVSFLGAVKRYRLIEEQKKAQILAYPCIYGELFCYAVAEAEVSACYPVTSTVGALSTTNMGRLVPGNYADPHWIVDFTSTVIKEINRPDLAESQQEVRRKALERFSPARILAEWERKVFNG